MKQKKQTADLKRKIRSIDRHDDLTSAKAHQALEEMRNCERMLRKSRELIREHHEQLEFLHRTMEFNLNEANLIVERFLKGVDPADNCAKYEYYKLKEYADYIDSLI